MNIHPRVNFRRLPSPATVVVALALVAALPAVGGLGAATASTPLTFGPFIPPIASPAATFAGGPASAEQLGASVALSANGQLALVGAPAADGGEGAVYFYAGSAGTWSSTPVATIAGPAGTKSEFGSSVALSANGEVAIVGAPGGGSEPSNDGAAYVYDQSGGTWPSTPTATFNGTAGSGGRLGFAVALSSDGQVALVGAPIAGDGSAYLYTGSGANWPSGPTSTFLGAAAGGDAGGEFGSSVALSADGQVALIGAPGAGTAYDGAAYVYAGPGGRWGQAPQATFIGPPGAGAELGSGVALSANGQDALVGAPGAGPSFDGVADLYTESAGAWPALASATFAGPTDSSAWLGTSVALSANGQVALLGGPVAGNGAAYLFAESAGAWPLTASTTFSAPPGSPDQLGSEVALSANGQVAMMGDAPFTGSDAVDGDAYVYSAPAGSYQALQTIAITSARPTSAAAGATYTPVATATSGLPVSFSLDSSSAPGACALSGPSTVKLTGAGSCLIDANQAGDAAWAAAAQVQIAITVRGTSAKVSIVSSSATVSGAYISVELACQGGRCAGGAELLGHTSSILAKASYSLKTGAEARVKLKLSSAGAALFGQGQGQARTEELVVTVRGGKQATKRVAVT